MDIKVSIVTVVYNSNNTIEKTIQSVLSQNYPHYEYCVIDGGSTDGTVKLVNNYTNQIDCFVSEKDSGIYNAMNKALSMISGDVVIFLNSGDLFYCNDSVARIVDQFDDGTDVVIAKELIEGKACETFSSNTKSIYVDAFFPHQATFSRVSLYKEDGMFDESYRICADYDWILREYYLGRNIKWIDDVVSVYDADGVSSSVKCTAEQYIISNKYLHMSGDTNMIPFMKEYYSDMFRKIFFRRLIKDSVSDNTISSLLRHELCDRSISVWGFGTIGKAICSFLLCNDVIVHRIYDSNMKVQNTEYTGIPVLAYDLEYEDYIIVSSENYETEICSYLTSIGKKSGENYISYTDFSSLIVSGLLKLGYDDQGFKEFSGLDVLDYIGK
jgi:glycosyltransferase involved in cell wall biosynthesis